MLHVCDVAVDAEKERSENCAEAVYFSRAFPHTCFDVSSANSGSAAGGISLLLIAELS